MVSSIPPPSLNELLPAFLSHIPASFASPKPPPSLPPLLTPLTRSRLTHLSFNLSADDSSFLSLLTWSSNPSDGQSLHEHLGSQDYYFLHQPPSPNTFHLKGYRRLDGETLQALVSVPELELSVVYQFTADDILDEAGTIGNAWKVHDLRLSDGEDDLLRGGDWYESIDLAEDKFRQRAHLSFSQYTTAREPEQMEEDDDDDYWGRYDEEDTESSAGDQERNMPVSQQQSPVQLAANVLARRMLQEEKPQDEEEDAYYAQYANVEPVLDKNPSSTAAERPEDRRDSVSTMHTSASHYENPTTLSTPLTMFTQPSTNISPTITNSKVYNPNASNATLQPSKFVELETAAEVNTQHEVAIKQHVSTSIKSLYRLWKAGGMDGDDFGKFLEREVEVMRIVDEAEDGLGSE